MIEFAGWNDDEAFSMSTFCLGRCPTFYATLHSYWVQHCL